VQADAAAAFQAAGDEQSRRAGRSGDCSLGVIRVTGHDVLWGGANPTVSPN
jgi:hypothetical protein